MLDPRKRGAWYGDPEFKAIIMAQMLEHRKKDRFIKGSYRDFGGDGDGYDALVQTMDNFKGCAIGCLVTSKLGLNLDRTLPAWEGWHRLVEKEFNIPARVAKQIDFLFESQPSFADAAIFAVASVDAIPVGANLEELVTRLDHAAWHEGGFYRPYRPVDMYECLDCQDSARLHHESDVFLKELSNAPLMPAARALILAG